MCAHCLLTFHHEFKACTFVNAAFKARACEVCGTARPQQQAGLESGIDSSGSKLKDCAPSHPRASGSEYIVHLIPDEVGISRTYSMLTSDGSAPVSSRQSAVPWPRSSRCFAAWSVGSCPRRSQVGADAAHLYSPHCTITGHFNMADYEKAKFIELIVCVSGLALCLIGAGRGGEAEADRSARATQRSSDRHVLPHITQRSCRLAPLAQYSGSQGIVCRGQAHRRRHQQSGLRSPVPFAVFIVVCSAGRPHFRCRYAPSAWTT
jgi:hypothetical protein